jgi:hypothetical protein
MPRGAASGTDRGAMRRGIHNSGLLITVTALLLIAVSGYGAEPSPKRSVQLVTFPDTG